MNVPSPIQLARKMGRADISLRIGTTCMTSLLRPPRLLATESVPMGTRVPVGAGLLIDVPTDVPTEFFLPSYRLTAV